MGFRTVVCIGLALSCQVLVSWPSAAMAEAPLPFVIRPITQEEAQKARRFYTQGAALLARGRAQEAITSLEFALRTNPRLVDAHVALARARLEAGQFEEAVAQLKELADPPFECILCRRRFIAAARDFELRATYSKRLRLDTVPAYYMSAPLGRLLRAKVTGEPAGLPVNAVGPHCDVYGVKRFPRALDASKLLPRVLPRGVVRIGEAQLSPAGDSFVWVGEYETSYTYCRGCLDYGQAVESDIWWTSFDGSEQRRLTWSRQAREPDHSPDGRRLVFAERGGLEVMDLRGRSRQKLLKFEPEDRVDTGTGFVTYANPVWSPDGAWIASTAISHASGWLAVVHVRSRRAYWTGEFVSYGGGGGGCFAWRSDGWIVDGIVGEAEPDKLKHTVLHWPADMLPYRAPWRRWQHAYDQPYRD